MTLVALVTMTLNDHVLKHAFGNVLTGKLSDVAGLAFAPAVLGFVLAAALPRLAPRTVAWIAIAATGIGFTLAKASVAGAATASAIWSLGGIPTLIRADATDLLALPALALAWWVFRRADAHAQPRADAVPPTQAFGRAKPPSTSSKRTRYDLRRRVLVAITIPAAALAVMAKGPTPPPSTRVVIEEGGYLYVH